MGDFKGDGKLIFMIFIGAIIALVFMAPIADQIFSTSNTINIVNTTITPSSVGNGTVELLGREFVSGGIVTNATNGQILNNANYSINTTAGSSGLLTVSLVRYDGSLGLPNATGDVNVSYIANPDGFVGDGASRSILALVLIFAALAIVIFVIARLFDPDSSAGRLIRGKG